MDADKSNADSAAEVPPPERPDHTSVNDDLWRMSSVARAIVSADPVRIRSAAEAVGQSRARALRSDLTAAHRAEGVIALLVAIERFLDATRPPSIQPDSHRHRILAAVAQGGTSLTTSALANQLDLHVSEVSRTANRLAEDGLMTKRSAGKHRYWSASPRGKAALAALESVRPEGADDVDLRSKVHTATVDESILAAMRSGCRTTAALTTALELPAGVTKDAVRRLKDSGRVERGRAGLCVPAAKPVGRPGSKAGGTARQRRHFSAEEVMVEVERLRADGDLFSAREELRRALSGPLQSRYEPTDWPSIQLWSELGLVQRSLGRYLQAARTQEAAVQSIKERHRRGQPPMRRDDRRRASIVLTNAGMAHCDVGSFSKARRWLEEALEHKQQSFGAKHVETARTKGRIGIVDRWVGDYPSALEGLTTALKAETASSESKPYEMLKAHSNLGFALWSSGSLGSAVDHLRLALKMSGTRHNGGGLPASATVSTKLALVLPDEGDWIGALEHGHLALDIRRRVLSTDHPDVGVALAVLGGLYADRGETQPAEDLVHEGIRILVDTVGPKHPQLAVAWSCLGVIEVLNDRWDTAETYARRANRILSKSLGKRHPAVINTAQHVEAIRDRSLGDGGLRGVRLVAA